MTRKQLYALKSNLPRIKAQKRIENEQFEGLDHQGIYDLFYAAYGDNDLAEDMRLKFLESLVEQKTNATYGAR